MLFEPFEEGLHLPTVPVEIRHFDGGEFEGIGEEGEIPVLLPIVKPHQSETLWIFLEGGVFHELDFGIAQDVLRQPSFLSDVFELQVLFRPHDEERLQTVDTMEFCESVVATVEHVVRSGFIWDGRHGLRVHRCGGDVVEGRDTCFQVVENVGFHAALAPAEPCPGENREAQGNGCGIKGVHAAA